MSGRESSDDPSLRVDPAHPFAKLAALRVASAELPPRASERAPAWIEAVIAGTKSRIARRLFAFARDVVAALLGSRCASHRAAQCRSQRRARWTAARSPRWGHPVFGPRAVRADIAERAHADARGGRREGGGGAEGEQGTRGARIAPSR
jgi:hypothetical protein